VSPKQTTVQYHDNMDEIDRASKRVKTVGDSFIAQYHNFVNQLDGEECKIKKRYEELDEKKSAIVEKCGNPDASENDLIEINAGGRIIAAKRGTLCQIKGSRLEVLFSGRWDKELQKDDSGKIFLDVNPKGFQAIVDYLNEMSISSSYDPPHYPNADREEIQCIIDHLLELFGMKGQIDDSDIITNSAHASLLHGWLKEDGSDGEFHLLYRSSRDGLSGKKFHSKCDLKGCTLSVIETTDGLIIGGYSNESWESRQHGEWVAANKAFLFALSGYDISSPCKMKLKDPNDNYAIYHASAYGPSFGNGSDLGVLGSTLLLHPCTYESNPPWPIDEELGGCTIKEVEVFQVINSSTQAGQSQTQDLLSISIQKTTLFSSEVKDALNKKLETLKAAEQKVFCREKMFEGEQTFIDSFASGETKDIVKLNVSGTTMTTKRSTLRACEDSILSRQFDDSTWTEQGLGSESENIQVNEWTPKDVTSWAQNINNIPGSVANIFAVNQIAGNELLALKKDGLMMLGIERTGTLCLLLEEINKLEKASQDVVTLIEHSPYCFGRILDYLRMKQLHSQKLAKVPPLPKVSESEKGRFEKVVKYFFPGDSAKLLLG